MRCDVMRCYAVQCNAGMRIVLYRLIVIGVMSQPPRLKNRNRCSKKFIIVGHWQYICQWIMDGTVGLSHGFDDLAPINGITESIEINLKSRTPRSNAGHSTCTGQIGCTTCEDHEFALHIIKLKYRLVTRIRDSHRLYNQFDLYRYCDLN